MGVPDRFPTDLDCLNDSVVCKKKDRSLRQHTTGYTRIQRINAGSVGAAEGCGLSAQLLFRTFFCRSRPVDYVRVGS